MYFADTLSRAHTTNIEPTNLYDEEMSITEIGVPNDTIQEIQENTEKDKTLSEIKNYTLKGWPLDKKQMLQNTKPFFTYRYDITIQDKMLLKGNQIIIPKKMQHKMLQKIHESHLGIIKCKQIARDSIFWPGMSSQIQDIVSRCTVCQEHRNILHKEPLISHEIKEKPFYKVGVDLFQINNDHYLILVDYYSKYPEIIKLNKLDSNTTIQAVKQIFSRHGIPKLVVSDNGPQ